MVFCLFLSAEDSSGCQNIAEFDILTQLESQARGYQFAEEEGGSASHSKACLFDIAFPQHLTALSVFSCKACAALSFRVHLRCVQTLVVPCMLPALARLKRTSPTKC